jgi:hypothetical protein
LEAELLKKKQENERAAQALLDIDASVQLTKEKAREKVTTEANDLNKTAIPVHRAEEVAKEG